MRGQDSLRALEVTNDTMQPFSYLQPTIAQFTRMVALGVVGTQVQGKLLGVYTGSDCGCPNSEVGVNHFR